MVKVSDIYLKTRYSPAEILLNVNDVIYLKFKLQLKFRNNNYSSITVNFHICWRQQIHQLKIKKNYHENIT